MPNKSAVAAVLAAFYLSISGAGAMGDDSKDCGKASGLIRLDSTQDDFKGFPEEPAAVQASSAIGQAGAINPRSLTGREKFRFYIGSTYGLPAIAYSTAGAGFSHARNSVPEWEQGVERYGKHLGSRFARRTIKYSIEASLGALFHEDPRYPASDRSGIFRRSLYATSRTFLSKKDAGGSRPAFSKFIAIAGATYISRQWYPEAHRTAKDYAASGGIGLGLEAAKNVAAEFWPDIKRRLRR